MTAITRPGASPARAGLDDFLEKPEPAFAWALDLSREADGATIHVLTLTSQEWKGGAWTHSLAILEPADVAHSDAALLLIAGGSAEDRLREKDLETGLALARACRARVAVLSQVPNQPLMGGLCEDALIVETFIRYVETRDADWPLLFPMVKSAVKAMDAVQAFARGQGRPVERFVVAGSSKRGWTTWLTGATDPRVEAIAPMVIPTLKMAAQNAHQLENFAGAYSEQIRDYTERGIVDRKDPASDDRLVALVDPYAYRDRLALPKLQINGTNDPFWTLDSMNLYWDDLGGPKWVVYLPNAGHDLAQNREYAIHGVGALFRHVLGGSPFPGLSWQFTEADGGLRLIVESDPAPKSALAWSATSDTLDFRGSLWTSTPLGAGGTLAASAACPEAGNVALFADLEYEVDGLAYHLSTQLRQTNRKASS